MSGPSAFEEPASLQDKTTLALWLCWFQTRLSLAGIEVQEFLDVALASLWGLAIFLLMLALTLLTLTMGVTFFFWDQWRWQSLLVLSSIYGLSALLAAIWARRKWRNQGELLKLTREVLRQDQQAWGRR
jgi:uncharacterized membrane protein YqjE